MWISNFRTGDLLKVTQHVHWDIAYQLPRLAPFPGQSNPLIFAEKAHKFTLTEVNKTINRSHKFNRFSSKFVQVTLSLHHIK